MGASESVGSSVGISVAGPLSLEVPSGYSKTEKCAGGTSELFDVPESENILAADDTVGVSFKLGAG